ncbi:MAG TPA: hypothetical protein ENN84_02250, partial [Candidatus Marinimicrobia bacterium]|nr:hypothetical protein [Candidatus Neomarinimicrobiota bacterium]
LRKEIQLAENRVKAARAKLGNQSFVERAPAQVVRAEQEKERSSLENLKLLQEHLRQIID